MESSTDLERRAFLRGMARGVGYLGLAAIMPVSLSSCETARFPKLSGIEATMQGPAPALLDEFRALEPEIVSELEKLPELKNGFSASDVQGLEDMVRLYHSDPVSFRSAFSEMDKAGYKDERPFCTPLQAAYWMCIDDRADELAPMIKEYDMISLLDASWQLDKGYKGRRISLTRKERAIIVNDVSTKEGIYLSLDVNPEITDKQIIYFFTDKQNLFSEESKKILYGAFERNIFNQRFANYKQVRDGLNDPWIIDYFVKKFRISYDFYEGSRKTPSMVFSKREGNCEDISAFIIDCMENAGIDAKKVHVNSKLTKYHTMVEFVYKNNRYLINDGVGGPVGIIGPIKSWDDTIYTPYRGN